MDDGSRLIYGVPPTALRILFIPCIPVGNACNYYRMTLPAETMVRKGVADAVCVDPNTPLDTLFQALHACDIAIFQRPDHWDVIRRLRAGRFNPHGPLMVTDHDDNIFAVSPYNQSYEFYGTEEVKITMSNETTFFWQNGMKMPNGRVFSLDVNRLGLDRQAQVLVESDMVTTAGDGLRVEYGRLNPNTVTIPNYLHKPSWRILPMRKDGWIRFGWQGGSSHYLDWTEVRDAVRIAMECEPHLRLVIYGQVFPGILKVLDPKRVDLVPWVHHMDAHPITMASLNLDFAMIPLVDEPFSRGKSVVKWAEFSALKIPSIVSKGPLYDSVALHGRTALRAGTTGEWVEAILGLARNPALRETLGQNAYERAWTDFDVEHAVGRSVSIYREALARKRRGDYLDGREYGPCRGPRWWLRPGTPQSLRLARGQPGLSDAVGGGSRERDLGAA